MRLETKLTPRILAIALLPLAISSLASGDDRQPPKVPTLVGEVRSVILYRDSALVTREISLDADTDEIVVDDLPERLQTASVFAEGGEGVTIRGVRVVTVPTAESTREDVAKIDEMLSELQHERNSIARMVDVAQMQLRTVEQMVRFSVSAADSDLNRGVLDADALMTLVDSAGERRTEIQQRLLDWERERETIDEQISRWTREKQQLTSATPMGRYQARVFLESQPGAPRTIRIRYTVEGCRWSPQYSVSTETGSDTLRIRYGAVITQTSGESWRKVKLILSTASPSVRAGGPVLAPLSVTTTGGGPGTLEDLFSDGGDQAEIMMGGMAGTGGMGMNAPAMPSQQSSSRAYQGKIQSLRKQQSALERQVSEEEVFANNASRDSKMNTFAGEMQQLELQISGKAAAGLTRQGRAEVSSQTYSLSSPVTLDSRRDQQLVDIDDLTLRGRFDLVATPLLSSYVYRQMVATNDTTVPFLQGPATIYLDNRFVGGMEMPSTAVGQKVTIGLGADNQLRTRRELVKKSDSVQGGNRRIEFEYRLVLSNFKSEGVRVALMDRIPVAADDRAINLQLGETSHPISDEARYRRVDRPLGILRFDVDLPAAAHGGKAMDVTYRYSMELDRNQSVIVPNVAEQARRGIEQRSVPNAMGGGGMGN